MDFSREFGLAPNVIEKDYVLGWMLAGISNHSELSQSWIFKGGTCLKKCYFETYRFSEDLDFTVSNSDHLNEELLIGAFTEIAEWVYEQAGIEIPVDRIRFKVYKNPRGRTSVEGRIPYRGPMQRRGDPASIKLDLAEDEILVLEPVRREVHHPYSDRPDQGIHIQSYCYEEVFAEKVRALGERERPRDLYDVVHLYRHDNMKPDRSIVMDTLEQKCAFKGVPVPTMSLLEDRPERVELEAEWANMLAHQLPELPPFEQFWNELPDVLMWLGGAAEKVAPEPIPYGRGEDVAWQPPSMAQAWHATVPLEIIRFAAANRLCVQLEYIKDDGTRTNPQIEPYSLRRTQDGNLLLHAVKHQTGGARSYRVDRIQGAKATKIPFVPRYTIELSPSGPISAPPIVRRSIGMNESRPRRSGISRGQSTIRKPSAGPTYVIECPYCNRKFNRKSYATKLNPHKDKQGYLCSGRTGFMVNTRY
ncbi:MAG: WYL domain-containing protein, partial [Deltaproteobacteria bacterium]|nr:WYL domain-containing protein [Deltaproteobacteria bacterium]NCP04177.1 WYL domain-containing protein [Deltaproteobacteria bacterium]